MRLPAAMGQRVIALDNLTRSLFAKHADQNGKCGDTAMEK